MLFQATITTDANTPRDEPVKTVLKLTDGLIVKVRVLFPPGPCGLAGVQLFHGVYQYYPASRGQWLRGNNFAFEDEAFYYMVSAPYELTIFTYNEDEQFDHEIIVQVLLYHTEDFIRSVIPDSLYMEMKKLQSENEEMNADRISAIRARIQAFFGG